MKNLLCILVVMASFFCCNPKPESEMYKDSELAVLMRDMYNQQLEWKDFVEQGKLINEFPEEFKKIHSATPTDKDVRTTDFKAMSNVYLSTINEFVTSKDSLAQKENYQNMIASCVQCHEQFCPGPIKKIKKLEIKE